MLYPIENRVREVRDLSGIWRFKIDRENCGLDESWQSKPLADTIPMAVPGSWNDMMDELKDKEHVGYVWYETAFTVPASWSGRRIVLRFGSATHHATVFVDGVEVARHKGGFLPFEADLTALLGSSEQETHRLTVALSNVLDWTCLPSGEVMEKDGYTLQDTFFDFYNYSGIHRPVKLYAMPKTYIEDITIKTALDGMVQCQIEGTDGPYRVKIIDEDGKTVAQGEAEGQLTLTVQEPRLWQPGNAYLYDLRVEGQSDVYTEPFGIRTVEVKEKSFLINGKPFYFRGFGKHEDSDIHGKGLDNALNVKDFALLKWIGANSFRTSHYPYSEELMRLADREGFVIIDEAPAVGMCFWDEKKVFDGSRVNHETLEHHLSTLRDLYARDKNHPCVVMWSVANEANTTEDGAVPYFQAVTGEMRRLDDTRPITIVQTMGPVEDKVGQMVDVIGLNRYYSWYTDHGRTEVIGSYVKREFSEWFEKYHKPLLVTEYGADTIAGLHKWPPAAFSEEYQCQFLNEFHKAFDELDFLVGEQVWAFADFQTKQGLNRVDGNKKGIFTRDRRPKMAALVLRERWTGKKEC